jgi:hypothetical protein
LQSLILDVLNIPGIEASSVYQAIHAKGRAQEAREILLSLGQERLGQPDEDVRLKVAAITDRDRLKLLIHRVFAATTWDELLASADE